MGTYSIPRTNATKHFIGITTTYVIKRNNGTTTTTKAFDASHSGVSDIRVGLPIGVEPVKFCPGVDMYSGMHDQGPLPPLKEGGPIALLIGCVGAAKHHNDDFLTKWIEEEKGNNENKTKKHKHQQHREQSDSPSKEAKKSSAFPNKRPKQ